MNSLLSRIQARGVEVPEEDDSGVLRLSPLDNVYSYFIFTVPLEDFLERRGKGQRPPTWHNVLAYFIVLVSFFLQGVLLWAIFNQTVIEHIAWKDGVLNPGTGTCADTGSLCMRYGGKFTCAPPTVQLSGRWDELDTDGDGKWTIEEATAARDELKCKFGVDPLEVFAVYKKFLLKREKLIFIEPALRDGSYIREVYFRYAAGDIIMCGYRSADMCPNLLKRGFFDKPLKQGNIPRVGKTIESALRYCHRLLEEGGTCERTLPSTYAVWRRSSEDQCGGADFSPMVYTHPSSGEYKSMLKVDYAARKDYHTADKSLLYTIYKMCIIGIYLFAMFVELRDILLMFIWVCSFKAANNPTRNPGIEVSLEDDEEVYEIKGIGIRHRVIVGIFMFLRLVMLGFLTTVGLSFLLKETDYIDLLLNGLGLIFIVEIKNLCYQELLDANLRQRCERIKPMDVPFVGPPCLKHDVALRDFFWFLTLVVFLVFLVVANYIFEVAPVADALECTCLSQGRRCTEADRFGKMFWDKYWSEDVPLYLQEIEQLEMAHNGTATGAAPGPAPAIAFGAPVAAYSARVGTVNSVASSADPSIMLRRKKSKEPPNHQHSLVSLPVVSVLWSMLGSSWGAWGYIITQLLSSRFWSNEVPFAERSTPRRERGLVGASGPSILRH